MSAWDTNDFQTDVIDRSRRIPVLVDFWAAWCGPCRVLGPVLERMAETSGEDWAFAKLDTEAHPEIAQRYGIRSIPAVKLFVDGEVADEFVGALPEPQIRDFLARALPNPATAEIERAAALIAEDDREGAREVLDAVIELRPNDVEPRLMLARAVLLTDPTAALVALEPIGAGDVGGGAAETLRSLVRLLVLEPEQIPPGRGESEFTAALAALRAGDPVGALDRLIRVIELDREYGDGIARPACLALFEYLGPDHPAASDRRVAFSNAVYA